jgi:hypothetical protein
VAGFDRVGVDFTLPFSTEEEVERGRGGRGRDGEEEEKEEADFRGVLGEYPVSAPAPAPFPVPGEGAGGVLDAAAAAGEGEGYTGPEPPAGLGLGRYDPGPDPPGAFRALDRGENIYMYMYMGRALGYYTRACRAEQEQQSSTIYCF